MKKLFLMLALAILLSACANQSPKRTPGKTAGLANPATTNCILKGGSPMIERDGGGNAYGVCGFKGGKQCEEWALMRGECPEGGLEVAGLGAAARYCVIRGGHYRAEGGSALCDFGGGHACPADAFLAGKCARP